MEVVAEANGTLSLTNISDFHAGAYEGLLSAMSSDGKVRGTRVEYPTLIPVCKYIALFDERPMFDNLRLAFLLHAGINSKPTTFLTYLDMIDTHHRCHAFAETLRAWAVPEELRTCPVAFKQRAWPAYLHTIRSASYFFRG